MELAQLVAHYTADFRARMAASAEEIEDAASTRERADALPADARTLLDTLLLLNEPGGAVEGLAQRIDSPAGERLWSGGFLLPRTRPSRGSTIDPRFYSASCRLTPHLAGRRPFADRLATQGTPAFPPGDARWDAVVIAAALERTPLKLKADGAPRRDQLDRLLKSLGDDISRWALALSVARATGRARTRAGTLVGLPESSPRKVSDPLALLDDHVDAGRVLQRVLGVEWISVPELQALLDELQPIIGPIHGLASVADVFHRVGIVDAARDHDGVVAVRLPTPGPELPPGFLLTPDMDILVASGELGPRDYGRLARLAPYVEGDRVHRHRLTREGVGLDMALGHTNPVEFLEALSRTGMPLSVRQSVEEWSRSVERLTILTGATLVEAPDGTFEVGVGQGRIIDYTGTPPASFHMDGDDAIVPIGRDALTVRSALERVGSVTERTDGAWRYRIEPRPTDGVDALLFQLRRHHVLPDLPASLEVRIRAANGLDSLRTEASVTIDLPHAVADALLRDPIAGPLLARRVGDQAFVREDDLGALRERLAQLGVSI